MCLLSLEIIVEEKKNLTPTESQSLLIQSPTTSCQATQVNMQNTICKENYVRLKVRHKVPFKETNS